MGSRPQSTAPGPVFEGADEYSRFSRTSCLSPLPPSSSSGCCSLSALGAIPFLFFHLRRRCTCCRASREPASASFASVLNSSELRYVRNSCRQHARVKVCNSRPPPPLPSLPGPCRRRSRCLLQAYGEHVPPAGQGWREFGTVDHCHDDEHASDVSTSRAVVRLFSVVERPAALWDP